jgi:hypothetical protein
MNSDSPAWAASGRFCAEEEKEDACRLSFMAYAIVRVQDAGLDVIAGE